MSEPNKIEEVTESSGCNPKSRCKYLHLMVGANLAFSILTFCMLFNVNHEMKNGIHRFSECRPPRHRCYDRGPRERNRARRQRDHTEEQRSEQKKGDHAEPVEKD